MNTESIDSLLPELAQEQTLSAPESTTDSGQDVENTAVTIDQAAPASEMFHEAPSVPLTASDILTGIKVDGEPFLDWALESSIGFLDLADLPAIQTVDRLRGLKEAKIRDKVQMANSVLVLLANYGSETDNEKLVSACELYAEKMKTIIKRLCL